MKFRAQVEHPEPMRGLEVPPEVVEALGGGKRPPVIITINGHSWRSRVAIMRGRFLLGLSKANRQAAGVATGDEVEVDVEFDAEPRVVVEPTDFARALDSDPLARAAYDADGTIVPVVYVRRSGRLEEQALPPHPIHQFDTDEHRRQLAACLAPIVPRTAGAPV